MQIVEALLISLLIMTCGYCTYTDIKNGVVLNKVLAVSGCICLVLNTVYYSVFAKEYLKVFIIDFIILFALSVLMYAFNLWAAGDSKLLFLIVFAIPGRFYDTTSATGVAPAIFILAFTFAIAFIYIVAESLFLRLKNKDKFDIFSFDKAAGFLKNYFVCSAYIFAINYLVILIFPDFFQNNSSLISLIGLFISIIIYKYDFFFRWFSILAAFLVAVGAFTAYSIMNGFILPDFKVYIYLAIILVFRFSSEKYNYKQIPTSAVKKGMIISAATIYSMSRSRIQGLPTGATEDMRSRISEEEAESIRRWETSKYGQSEISIVRKTPFAVFMSLGVIAFFIFRSGIFK